MKGDFFGAKKGKNERNVVFRGQSADCRVESGGVMYESWDKMLY